VTSNADASRRHTSIRSGKDVAGPEHLSDSIDQFGLLRDEEFGGF